MWGVGGWWKDERQLRPSLLKHHRLAELNGLAPCDVPLLGVHGCHCGRPHKLVHVVGSKRDLHPCVTRR